MPNDTPIVQTRDVSWEEFVRRAWGKEWDKAPMVYEFSGGAKREEPSDGGGVYNDE